MLWAEHLIPNQEAPKSAFCESFRTQDCIYRLQAGPDAEVDFSGVGGEAVTRLRFRAGLALDLSIEYTASKVWHI